MIRNATLLCVLGCGSSSSPGPPQEVAPSPSPESPSDGAQGVGSEGRVRTHPAFGERQSERDAMVDEQLQARDIVAEGVLEAMRLVPRHVLIPAEGQRDAYDDRPLPIGLNQTISQPYIVAAMTQALKLKPGDKVLEVGTGSGYQAAVLAEITDHVYTIEIVEPLGQRAQQTLHKLGYQSIQFRIGDGYQGWPDAAPFDAIIVTAAPPHIPQPLVDQLKVGGRMVIPVGQQIQDLMLIERSEDGREMRSLMGVRFVPMTGEAQKKSSRNKP